MKINETHLKGCYIIEPTVFNDERGSFYEGYHQQKMEATIGEKLNFIQDNVSISKKNVLRGLHFQGSKFSQAKLVQVLQGEVLDVIVDIRKDSPTYGEHLKVNLSHNNKKLIYLPRGMAHGFLALTDNVIFTYKCDNYYHPQEESGIIYNDPDLNINWGLDKSEIILSDKDYKLLNFKEI